MANMAPQKTDMPTQKPEERVNNFEEVALGYTEEMAINEAQRCLNCKNKPCVSACPVNVQIPDFISEIKQGNFKEALAVIKKTNTLPAICGRVCPQESQCESKCVRGIKGEPVGIGRLERFAADINSKQNTIEAPPTNNGHKVAVVGAGPSGLACAGDLVELGYDVTIYEALHKAGGVLVYGIPEFRLPKDIVSEEVKALTDKGVKIKTNSIIGKTFTVSELMESGFDAVYISSGAGSPNFMGIEGENLNGVYSANEFLTRINLMNAYKKEYDTPVAKPNKVAVIGGGNVAMDAARCAIRLGANDVYVIYRRSEEEMPARLEEIHHAKEEGIQFKFLSNPVKIHGDENFKVKSIECVKMTLSDVDSSGRRRPVALENSNHFVDVDTVVMAIGNSPNRLVSASEEKIKTDNRGRIVVDENMKTTMDGVFAGGDAVTGAATVILAMGAGKKAAASIDEYVKNKQAK